MVSVDLEGDGMVYHTAKILIEKLRRARGL